MVAALQASNVIVPAGQARVGGTEYNVLLNSSPTSVAEFARIPLRVVAGAPVLLGDVARVADGYAVQTNIVRVNGKRATYLAILKHADASTLAVVDATREALPSIEAVAPQGLELKIDFDQSLFVRAAISGVVREAILASILVSLMIFVFLGSWRSMVIVSTSIPLAIFTAFLGLKFTDQTINIMTLGGLALAIGMLVDDATVAIENIHRNRALGKPLTVAILDGARQVAIPAIVATLSICIVFFPVVLLYGPAKYLFTPLALAVVFAMLVRPVAYPGAAARADAAAGRAGRGVRCDAGARGGPQRAGAARGRVQPQARRSMGTLPGGVRPRARDGARSSAVHARHGARARALRCGAVRSRGHRFLSHGRRRPDEAARPCAAGHPHRADRAAGGGGGAADPPGDSPGGTRDDQ